MSDNVDSVVVPRELWERIILNVSCQVNSPVRHAGRACYDRGLVDKETTDQLLTDIRRHNQLADAPKVASSVSWQRKRMDA